jgi:hypothetical protein
MIVHVSTVLNCSAAKAWNEVQKSSLLLHVIWPLARVVPVGAPFPERWSEGLTFQYHFETIWLRPAHSRFTSNCGRTSTRLAGFFRANTAANGVTMLG